MSQEQKNNLWHPSASLEDLKKRACLLAEIRRFFEKRSILEVETPLMCSSVTTDPFIDPIPVLYSSENSIQKTYYLQTSPEFAMKRLLAAGIGPIYQICKAFRNGEVGRLHNPEFTMLEWYRPGFDHHALMSEIEELLQQVLGVAKSERITYGNLFQQKLKVDPHKASISELRNCAISNGISIAESTQELLTAKDWLDLLMTHCIEPHLGFQAPIMVYDYPDSMAALSKIRPGNPAVAERFEVYSMGIELANGYHELTDPGTQYARFLKDNEVRKHLNYASIPIDNHLIQALEAGLPATAGVALGFDRLLMLKLRHDQIENIIAFTIDRA